MMSGVMRLLLSACVLVTAALLLVGASSASPEGSVLESAQPTEREGLARLVGTCTKCHEDVCKEWEGTLHAQSWTDPVFQAAIAELADKGESCAPCHAPQELMLQGMGKLPLPRKNDREVGVNCVTCHMKGNRYLGPYDSTGHGGVDADDGYRKADMCLSCHGQPQARAEHDQGTSYLAGTAAKEGRTCQSCHMPAVQRKLVTSPTIKEKYTIGEQACRVHAFSGARRGVVVRGAAELKANFKGDNVEVVLTALTGHALPATEGRTVRLRIAFSDATGTSVGQAYQAWRHGNEALPATGPVTLSFPAANAAKAHLILEQELPKAPGRVEALVQSIAELEITR
ncbi:MAG: hypothetical protein EXS14_06775 [Planctomycetes bacterium]|nr:hypothetical protein [Planctomycetota bacterium]